MRFLDTNNIFHPCSPITCMVSLILTQIDAIFLDYAKALDKLPHQQLNLCPKILNWITELQSAWYINLSIQIILQCLSG